ncbi:FliM/FliN family flagellar motor C-terminal domain-containing protein [Pelagimonas varians]|uniref:Surface presentation of antigens (SPOA) n=1 Tax=Pelagimonas varians TaxID=696760 RepID=A0A238L5R4_9RHOB|nr:FliM/FliN family flagellar motor C-terminal domain-containing protein [Pelagimonas varians]PYG25577.1 flagellar motor switch/type III secretory pathway protein FliN [Pelagimonas varians]SMX50453.1 Surface presentation of antigens (SPOA) [Pelagimonas varians]
MADGARQGVLGQKAQAAQRAFEARGMSPSKALRRALSRTADVLWDLALVTQGVSVEMHDQDGVIDGLGQKDLLVLLDGPDGALGIASIEREIMTGVIEVQTIMQVTQMPVDDERVLTPTDAAMMAPLLDGTLEKLVSNLDHHPLCAQLEGYRFGAMIEDARAASLLLDASSYRTFRAEVDLALGRRKGALSITLPERVHTHKDTSNPDGTEAPGPHEELIGKIPARLDTILTRLTMTLAQARELKPGDLLPLPPDVLDRVELIAGRGQVIAKGRLGQLHNQRAVRLTWPLAAAKPPAEMGEMLDGRTTDGAAELAALPDISFNSDMPDIGVGSDLPDIGMGDFGAEDQMEELPDLPPMDFEADTGDFDMDLTAEPAEAGNAMMADLGDFDFGLEPAEIEES